MIDDDLDLEEQVELNRLGIVILRSAQIAGAIVLFLAATLAWHLNSIW
jgi:hypothetical protein